MFCLLDAALPQLLWADMWNILKSITQEISTAFQPVYVCNQMLTPVFIRAWTKGSGSIDHKFLGKTTGTLNPIRRPELNAGFRSQKKDQLNPPGTTKEVKLTVTRSVKYRRWLFALRNHSSLEETTAYLKVVGAECNCTE